MRDDPLPRLTTRWDYRGVRGICLALQLRFNLDVSFLGWGLMRPSPERPCDDVSGLGPTSGSVSSRCVGGEALRFVFGGGLLA
jgi:hypothetical protein